MAPLPYTYMPFLMETLQMQYWFYNCMCITYAMDTSSLKYMSSTGDSFSSLYLPSFEEVLVYITNLLLCTYTASMGAIVTEYIHSVSRDFSFTFVFSFYTSRGNICYFSLHCTCLTATVITCQVNVLILHTKRVQLMKYDAFYFKTTFRSRYRC